MLVAKALVICLGSFFLLLGVARAAWEVTSWGWQVRHGLRPPVYPDGTTRVYVVPDCIIAAFGAFLLALGVLI